MIQEISRQNVKSAILASSSCMTMDRKREMSNRRNYETYKKNLEDI